jgi:hypothetical protein
MLIYRLIFHNAYPHRSDHSKVIQKSVAEIPFKKRLYQIAVYTATRDYLTPLPDAIVNVACTVTYNAISEYR